MPRCSAGWKPTPLFQTRAEETGKGSQVHNSNHYAYLHERFTASEHLAPGMSFRGVSRKERWFNSARPSNIEHEMVEFRGIFKTP
jgi:hypothetical protein